ncbi:alpha-L-fucosidase [Chitinophaga costaii]|uniref:alpha-L-fucosidase n=1 Tax=Chitinophaga costaii TaxID=1335309 RepID=A0A1C4G0G0_9BACT|nr:alpha-L-fucosidase [Chitinophaga costaii]PUZ19969.1 alpha-L-fucosidase [Chitinophaga costaii]SCC61626.1 alpha-L-fucosidase [Chitinophaga costaii]
MKNNHFSWPVLLLLALLPVRPLHAQQAVTEPASQAARDNFSDMRFGLFIHWGVYSLLGDGEWVMYFKKIPYSSYSRLPDAFYPHHFDAKAWVKMAKDAGMKYITITARHHDGFSIFNSKASAYNIMATPYHTDPLAELAKVCKQEGIKLFFYYSLLDWGREDYAYGSPIVNGKPSKGDWDHYIAFMKAQLTELLTNYPDIAGIWFDGEWDRPDVNWHFDEIYALIHKLKPNALIGNNHHHAARAGEDFQMFERDLPGENKSGFSGDASISAALPLETCETMNNSWGFTITDNHYKSVRQVIQLLVNAAGRNANLLLNVGPMANGVIQPEFADTLTAAGKWLARYGSSIYGTRQGFLPPQSWGVTTARAGHQYVHILQNPGVNPLFLPGLPGKLRKAVTYGTELPVKYTLVDKGILLYLDGFGNAGYDNIIDLTFE